MPELKIADKSSKLGTMGCCIYFLKVLTYSFIISIFCVSFNLSHSSNEKKGSPVKETTFQPPTGMPCPPGFVIAHGSIAGKVVGLCIRVPSTSEWENKLLCLRVERHLWRVQSSPELQK